MRQSRPEDQRTRRGFAMVATLLVDVLSSLC